jgi:hypothetical protein
MVLVCGVSAADAEASRRAGYIKIVSGTRGAQVLIDGQPMGRVPLSDPIPVTAGQHVVKVSKPGYTDYLEVVVVRTGQVKELEVDLFPLGRVPVDLELKPGAHSVRVALAGHQDVIRRWVAKAGRVARLRAKMVKLGVVAKDPKVAVGVKKKWYQKWWFWASVASGVVAIGLTVVLPLALYKEDATRTFNEERNTKVP